MLNLSTKIVSVSILLLISTMLCAQVKKIGIPFINNYSRDLYEAGTQNWSISQDDNGVMYFANNEGLLIFNGSEWELYPLPNGSIIRVVFCIDNKIFVGGFNEFGYFEKDNYGQIIYHTLTNLLSERDKNFDEIWRILKTDNGLVFQSYTKLFIYDNNNLLTIEPRSRFGFSYIIDDDIYIVDREFGLYTLENKQLRPFFLNDEFFKMNEISFMIKNDNLMFGTTNNGIYIYKDDKITPWEIGINKQLIKHQIYTGLKLNDEQLAIGTIQNGLYILDFEGNIDLHLNRFQGIQNNTILSLFYDNYKNLWLGLDNGIDMLETNSPITVLNYSNNIETSYSSIIHNDILYIGTNQGLFAKPANEITNELLDQSGFIRIEGTQGQVWNLKIIDGVLFCGHNFGTFIIEGFIASKISDLNGGWDFLEVPWNKNFIIGGTYTGLNLYKKSSAIQQWINQGIITGMMESCKELFFDTDKNLWIIHGLKGIFKIKLSDDLTSISNYKIYNNISGLPELPYSMLRIQDELLLLASDTLYNYYQDRDTFIINTKHTELFSGINGISRIIPDKNGDLWFFTNETLGVLRLMEDGTYVRIEKPFRRVDKIYMGEPFENIFSINKDNIFIGSKEGIIHYTLDYNKNYNHNFNTFLTEVKSRSRKFDDNERNQDQLIENKLDLTTQNSELPFKYGSVSFKFYAPYYEAQNEINYSYQLIGYDIDWSEWSNITFKEYTNLDEGVYTFKVKARNIYNNESSVCSYTFEVEPPFYRTQLAYAIYVIMIIALVLSNILYFNRKVEKTRNIEQEKLVVKEREFKKEVEKSEQKIEKLEQEKLNHEMRLKNIELANSTMHLVQKNKLLNNIKKELTSVAERAKITSVKTDIKALITKIDRDVIHDKYFKLFDKYFEQVHRDFLNRIKEKHPNLTAKDLRLCAYLRMNLTTKEIAPLLNVSIRGLEISRYRLRKKLELEHNMNLTDYIMNV